MELKKKNVFNQIWNVTFQIYWLKWPNPSWKICNTGVKGRESHVENSSIRATSLIGKFMLRLNLSSLRHTLNARRHNAVCHNFFVPHKINTILQKIWTIVLGKITELSGLQLCPDTPKVMWHSSVKLLIWYCLYGYWHIFQMHEFL